MRPGHECRRRRRRPAPPSRLSPASLRRRYLSGRYPVTSDMAGVPATPWQPGRIRRCAPAGVFWVDHATSLARQEEKMTALLTDDVRTEALFASNLQRSQRPSNESIREAVIAALERLGA